MNRILSAAVLLAVILAGCSATKPDVGECKAAMKSQFLENMAEGDNYQPPKNWRDGMPAECEGIDEETATKLGSEIAEEFLN